MPGYSQMGEKQIAQYTSYGTNTQGKVIHNEPPNCGNRNGILFYPITETGKAVRMHGLRIVGMVVLSCVIMYACSDDTGSTEEDILQQADRDFMDQASYSSHAAIEFGSLAEVKGESDAVRIYGSAIADDQADALNDLEELAAYFQYTIPAGLDADAEEIKTAPETLTGISFDSAYIKTQVLAHAETEALFEYQIQNGKNKRLVNYAQGLLPEIRMYSAVADSIQAVFEEQSSGRKSKTLKK
ncbi:MAG TPA: DUF4142 domain-containing protein [Ohtaekwangia sp.]